MSKTFKESSELELRARALMRLRGQACPDEQTLRGLEPAKKRVFREQFSAALKELDS